MYMGCEAAYKLLRTGHTGTAQFAQSGLMDQQWVSYIFTGRNSKTFPPTNYLTWVFFWYHPYGQLVNQSLLAREWVPSRKQYLEICSSNNFKNSWHGCINAWILSIRSEHGMFSWHPLKVSILRKSNFKPVENWDITLQLSTITVRIQKRRSN